MKRTVAEGLLMGCGAFQLMFDGCNLLQVGMDHKSLLLAGYCQQKKIILAIRSLPQLK